MKAKHHFWSSLAVGGMMYLSTESVAAFTGTMLGGFFIDADHLIDQLWSIYNGAPHTKNSSSLAAQQKGFLGWLARYLHRRKLTRLPLVFHSYELMAALFLIALLLRTPFLAGLFVGYLLHLALDICRHYKEFRSPFFYSISYRLIHGFRRDRLVKSLYL
jgi:hypothetical protein